ncbi:MAG: hypothetical protein ABII01_03550 [Candidatus Woesearchaeota archaeon]
MYINHYRALNLSVGHPHIEFRDDGYVSDFRAHDRRVREELGLGDKKDHSEDYLCSDERAVGKHFSLYKSQKGISIIFYKRLDDPLLDRYFRMHEELHSLHFLDCLSPVQTRFDLHGMPIDIFRYPSYFDCTIQELERVASLGALGLMHLEGLPVLQGHERFSTNTRMALKKLRRLLI